MATGVHGRSGSLCCACAAVASRISMETTSSARQRGASRVGRICACASRAGPLGRSGHHLGTGGGAEPTGSDRAGHRCRHEPRIVSEPRPHRAAQPRSCQWGYMLAEVVWPWSELRGAPTSGSLFRCPPLHPGPAPPPGIPRTPAQHPDFCSPGPGGCSLDGQHAEPAALGALTGLLGGPCRSGLPELQFSHPQLDQGQAVWSPSQ